ncbi:uncharacterized protein si:ch211-102c2.4 [Ictalurus punctatus]|uniref:Uncharacterized protein si:ch211-102c2.4 n=1 Tax=Ictalurus punctatus TaxID=7998 RepID=A0A2D0PKZ1_ICTPU|nr:uncharacterized protein si:ch211-102c2.4 [Ictalurus punctatus]
MFLLTSTLLLVSAVVYVCHAEQMLKCPYDSKFSPQKYPERVWCKKEANNQSCCRGFTFTSGEKELDGGRLSVQDDGKAFTVSVRSLSQGDGVYWCGLKNGSGIIVKLAEGEIHNPLNLAWSIIRWLLFVLLLLAVISTHMCYNSKKAKD